MTTIVLIVLVAVAVILLIVLLMRSSNTKLLQIEAQLSSFEKNQERTERALKEEIAKNREETAVNSKQLREEINSSNKDNRDELSRSLKSFEERFNDNVKEFNELQKQKFDNMANKQTELIQSTELRLDKMKETIEARLKLIQDDNSEKLEKMRAMVDEKLHKTLEERLSQSFKIVSERLELVHKGLGEMQNLAVGVGDLKKVLSNVKTRGILGEIQLGNILEQILTPEQYSRNVATKKGSRDHVEFAIKLPGKDDSGEVVYLPLDSKFPIESYLALNNAYEHGEPAAIEEAAKLLESSIKKCAKDIRDKYIDPPNTTDFGILFLPIEGLYAEVVRRPALLEVLQREYKIMIAGPTTLSAFLNSLHMGFRTLAIEKRSSEVWKILGAIKTEFEIFGKVLTKAQEKINQASHEIDDLVGKRTRKIQSKLKSVQEMPVLESKLYLFDEADSENESTEENI
jgi:DNA recombination protein RmuC